MEYTKNTRKIHEKDSPYFNNNDKVKYHGCAIYRVICSCGADYLGETIRNSEIRWNEHITVKHKNSDCVKHLNNHFDHEFRWFVLSHASKNSLKRKILEVHYMKTCQPSLINQINGDLLKLFRNADLKITVGHGTMSDQNQKVSDQTKNTPEILFDGKNSEKN